MYTCHYLKLDAGKRIDSYVLLFLYRGKIHKDMTNVTMYPMFRIVPEDNRNPIPRSFTSVDFSDRVTCRLTEVSEWLTNKEVRPLHIIPYFMKHKISLG